jgi:hypothetical protein
MICRKQVATMAKSDRKCPNPNCRTYGEPTTFLVCSKCHRATALSIYQPRTANADQRRMPGSRAAR